MRSFSIIITAIFLSMTSHAFDLKDVLEDMVKDAVQSTCTYKLVSPTNFDSTLIENIVGEAISVDEACTIAEDKCHKRGRATNWSFWGGYKCKKTKENGSILEDRRDKKDFEKEIEELNAEIQHFKSEIQKLQIKNEDFDQRLNQCLDKLLN